MAFQFRPKDFFTQNVEWPHSKEFELPKHESGLLMRDIPWDDTLKMPDSRLHSALEQLCTMQSCQKSRLGSPVNFLENELLRLAAEINWLVVYHDLYPRLVDMHFQLRRVGETQNSSNMMEPMREGVLEEIRHLHGSEDVKHLLEKARLDRNLNKLMEQYCSSLQDLLERVTNIFENADSFCTDFDNQVKKICETSLEHVQGEGVKNLDASSADALSAYDSGDKLQCALIDKYKSSILELKGQFLRQKKSGKLPKSATSILKDWWDCHIEWPYPSEAEKKKFRYQSALSPTQINNWFINQRKRHWHKLFKPGGIPDNHAEARKILLKKGILKK